MGILIHFFFGVSCGCEIRFRRGELLLQGGNTVDREDAFPQANRAKPPFLVNFFEDEDNVAFLEAEIALLIAEEVELGDDFSQIPRQVGLRTGDGGHGCPDQEIVRISITGDFWHSLGTLGSIETMQLVRGGEGEDGVLVSDRCARHLVHVNQAALFRQIAKYAGCFIRS